MLYSCTVIVLFDTGLYKSAFPPILLIKLGFCLFLIFLVFLVSVALVLVFRFPLKNISKKT